MDHCWQMPVPATSSRLWPIVMMNALFLIGLTYKVMTKRFVVAWDTGAIAAVYVVAVALSYLLTR